jgi:hypothetical protein
MIVERHSRSIDLHLPVVGLGRMLQQSMLLWKDPFLQLARAKFEPKLPRVLLRLIEHQAPRAALANQSAPRWSRRLQIAFSPHEACFALRLRTSFEVKSTIDPYSVVGFLTGLRGTCDGLASRS